VEFKIEDAGSNRYGACHKITIKDVDDSMSTFWYVKAEKDLPDFDQRIHMDLVKLMHAISKELQPGHFQSFSCGNHDYHIMHVGQDEYTIKILR
jgi:hypothetical protein